ncbi:MAG: hypothetical protein M0D55_12555 [Elusimicrobiota bacterium]|nr:MAG: hypothetical protein M0D55_12555 [Elusimicrobiota bacterium]
MKLAKIALVALALWMPSASFAAAVFQDKQSSCPAQEEQRSPDEAAGEAESDALFLASPVRLLVAPSACFVDHAGHEPLDGHLVEPLLPPPNPAAR